MINGKTAVVTGGSGAIGGAVCRRLARDGFFVFVCGCRRSEAAEAIVEEIRGEGGGGSALLFDVSDAAAAEQSLAEVMADSRPVAAIVHAAGVVQPSLMMRTPASGWESMIATNLNGFFFTVRPLLHRLIRSRSGCVIAVSSVVGERGLEGQSAYAASKMGLVGAVRSLARETGPYNIRANIVSPGWIEGGMNKAAPPTHVLNRIPLRRPGCSEEVASVVSFLCSDQASYVTGAVIPVSGGLDM